MKKYKRIWIGLILLWVGMTNAAAMTIVNPVLPGDRPDPTVIRIGDTYWASTSSNEWSPLFPIFKSDDLIHWELVSYVFPEGAPQWALNNFWAPELVYDQQQKKVYLYYTARSKETGRLAVAVASASAPDGKYTDHGPLVSQQPGSIDAFEVTDNDGKIYMVWKEDGNSMGRPTPLWAQQINAGRTSLQGEPVELFRNNEADNHSWERWLIEGVCIFKKGDYYYATYSGGSCCDKQCNYKTGVARSRSVLGPWEKNPANPILSDNRDWRCSGHGTVVEKEGDLYMLYHAYNTRNSVYVGREGVLEKLDWTADGWPRFANQSAYDRQPESLDFEDRFEGDCLNPVWQWRVTQDIRFHTGKEGLRLGASVENRNIGTLLVQQTKALNYTLQAVIDLEHSNSGVRLGIALVGATDNHFGSPLAAISILAGKGELTVCRTAGAESMAYNTVPVNVPEVTLEMSVRDGYILTFSYKVGNRTEVLAKDIDASGLVPWGMGFRFGLISFGNDGEWGVFEKVNLFNR